MNESIGIPGGVASLDSTGNVPIDQLANINTDLFIVVSELPTEYIKEGKIYCIKDTSSTAQDNGYIEYAYINNKWEKIGEFQAEPDLSGYAKLSGATFNGDVRFDRRVDTNNVLAVSQLHCGNIYKHHGAFYLRSAYEKDISYNKTYNTAGDITDVGTQEDFTFTLEDGSTVTKSIRVISTTSQAGA